MKKFLLVKRDQSKEISKTSFFVAVALLLRDLPFNYFRVWGLRCCASFILLTFVSITYLIIHDHIPSDFVAVICVFKQINVLQNIKSSKRKDEVVDETKRQLSLGITIRT